MSLRDHLSIGTPVVWVLSDEPHRVTELIIAGTPDERTIYRLDALRGLLSWDRDAGDWKQVLVTDERDPSGEPIRNPTHQLGQAILEVYEHHGIMIVDHAHRSTNDLVGFYGVVNRDYLDAVRANDADRLPAQFILISCKDEVPPEIARECVRVTFELPDPDALGAIVDHLARGRHAVDDDTRRQIVRAGQGLSEHEFSVALARSLHDDGALEAETVNHLKIETITAGGLVEIRPAAATMADVGGLDGAKAMLERNAWLWTHPEEAEKFHTQPLRKILAVGVPGTGKSLLCEAAASMLGLDLAKTGVAQQMSKWVGESESNMRRTFGQIRAMAPICMWIDEFGRDLSGSGSQGDSGTTDRVHGEFLTGLQELPDTVFLMCAANRIDALPPEMLRADRFDKIIFVGLPTPAERAEIFRIHLGPDAKDHDLERLAKATEFFTGAEIKALVRECRFRICPVENRPVTTVELIEQAGMLKGRVVVNHFDAVQEMYRRAETEWDWASSAQANEAHRIIDANITQVLGRGSIERSRTGGL